MKKNLQKKLGRREWIAKYFSSKPNMRMTWEKAVDHCIKKWSGGSEKVLESYGAVIVNGNIVFKDDLGFFFDAETCALCVKTSAWDYSCDMCLLYHARGCVSCCKPRYDEDTSPYSIFEISGDNKPMLYWLRRTKRFLQTKKWRKIRGG